MELTYGHLIEKTGRKIKQELQKEINRLGFGITVDQWVLLLELYESGKMPQVELEERTFKDAPTITRILDILLQKSLINKYPCNEDRRKFLIELSEQGRNLVDEMLPHLVVFRKNGWKGLSMQDWEDLQRIMNTIFVNFSNDND